MTYSLRIGFRSVLWFAPNATVVVVTGLSQSAYLNILETGNTMRIYLPPYWAAKWVCEVR